MTQTSQNEFMVRFINDFMDKYRVKGSKCSAQDPAYQFVTKEAVDLIRQAGIVNENEYEIYGRCAQGNWAHCPYVDIMYKRFEKRGVCIAYILSYNCDEVYLTLNQFVGNAGKRELRKIGNEVLDILGDDIHGFHKGNKGVDFGSQQIHPERYREATILYKKYERNNIPDESTLHNDLADLMELYGRWVAHYENTQQKDNSTEESSRSASANAVQGIGKSLNEKISEEIDREGYLHQNVIFYGVPGCGKSHRINALLHLDDKVNGLEKEYYKRILFHPEYSYSDFVGQLRPVTEGKNITYQFDPGSFTEILCDAYKDREHDYFLIIEEINRGNAPAIFGDLFQLLDRKDGVSEYSIDNKDILDYFERELEIARESEKDDISAMAQAVETIKREGVRIPENLTIFATMNTCDQNVFTLDTAFKRRWRMSRIENKFDSILSTWKIQFENGKDVSWKDFAEKVNDAILNNCNDGTAAEDKQLGTHFIKESDLTPARRFAEKVLLYLWDDVAKYDKSQLFDTKNYKTLDMVIDEFVDGNNVFSPNCAELQELYKKMNQPEQTNNNGTEVSLEAEAGTDRPAEGAPEAADEEQGRE